MHTPTPFPFRLHSALAQAIDSHLLMRLLDLLQHFDAAGMHIHVAVGAGMANLVICASEPCGHAGRRIRSLSGFPPLAPIVLGDAGERHGDVQTSSGPSHLAACFAGILPAHNGLFCSTGAYLLWQFGLFGRIMWAIPSCSRVGQRMFMSVGDFFFSFSAPHRLAVTQHESQGCWPH